MDTADRVLAIRLMEQLRVRLFRQGANGTLTREKGRADGGVGHIKINTARVAGTNLNFGPLGSCGSRRLRGIGMAHIVDRLARVAHPLRRPYCVRDTFDRAWLA